MAADNHSTIVGNLVEDPEVRFTSSGIAVANPRVAVTQRVQQDGQWRDGDTSFFKVNVWRGQAENLAESLSKGDRVMVTGRLRQRAWETAEGRSGRSPNWRPMRSAPRSSGPRPRSSARVSAATASAAPGGSGRPSAAATSTISHPSDTHRRCRRPRLRRGRWLVSARPEQRPLLTASHASRNGALWVHAESRPGRGQFAVAATPIGGRVVTGSA
jgi:single-strand DNA-binding protein